MYPIHLGWTPLHLATYFGHKDVMEILLSRGADINAINEVGDTCLHKAAFIGRQVFLSLRFSVYFESNHITHAIRIL